MAALIKSCNVVCHPGYFHSGSDCIMCSGNKIKILAGNAPNCDADLPCDGLTNVPNAQHTDCGLLMNK